MPRDEHARDPDIATAFADLVATGQATIVLIDGEPHIRLTAAGAAAARELILRLTDQEDPTDAE